MPFLGQNFRHLHHPNYSFIHETGQNYPSSSSISVQEPVLSNKSQRITLTKHRCSQARRPFVLASAGTEILDISLNISNLRKKLLEKIHNMKLISRTDIFHTLWLWCIEIDNGIHISPFVVSPVVSLCNHPASFLSRLTVDHGWVVQNSISNLINWTWDKCQD
jgi:hypothetical protein